jgi:Kazal-type serine protease inhibitor-like protein
MKRISSRSIVLHLLAAGVLSACTVAVVDTPRPIPRPQACTFEYAPVCGQRGDRLRTFSNACLARAEGFRVVARGQCRRPASVRPPQSAACSREFVPVCALRGNRRQTFSNACMARVEGFRPLHQGRCR